MDTEGFYRAPANALVIDAEGFYRAVNTVTEDKEAALTPDVISLSPDIIWRGHESLDLSVAHTEAATVNEESPLVIDADGFYRALANPLMIDAEGFYRAVKTGTEDKDAALTPDLNAYSPNIILRGPHTGEAILNDECPLVVDAEGFYRAPANPLVIDAEGFYRAETTVAEDKGVALTPYPNALSPISWRGHESEVISVLLTKEAILHDECPLVIDAEGFYRAPANLLVIDAEGFYRSGKTGTEDKDVALTLDVTAPRTNIIWRRHKAEVVSAPHTEEAMLSDECSIVIDAEGFYRAPANPLVIDTEGFYRSATMPIMSHSRL
jgi:NAD(P)H-hydrate repair Nnr-like enzyme with NAD(P)H-hydrate dehydratase domain